MRWWFPILVALLGACPNRGAPVVPAVHVDHTPHKAAVAALIQPLVDAGDVNGIVVGLYAAGRTEVYGFGKGPGNAPPNASTLFEIGSVTKIFTSLLLADAVQRQEVALETELAELLPTGVTVPTRDKRTITLGMLALHTSGLPPLPPSLEGREGTPNPYAKYGEDDLYADLIHTQLLATPGDTVVYSNYGAGVLGFALGKKLGPNFEVALEGRVLQPLGLGSTFMTVPDAAKVRRATGTNSDLVPVPYWYFDALAGAGALVSDAHDLLTLIDEELDAASGSRRSLRQAMHFSQEPRLDHPEGDNESLGWQIDSAGRYWHNGQTGGFHAFIGFDPKTRRGVVVLASTGLAIYDRFADQLYQILAGEDVKPPVLPTPAQLAPYVGTYDLSGDQVVVTQTGKRLYITGRGTAPYRMIPLDDHDMWIEQLQAVVVFQRHAGRVDRAVFIIGNHQYAASRVEAGPAGSGAAGPAGSGAAAP